VFIHRFTTREEFSGYGEHGAVGGFDEHGGIYDHVVPPACTPDKFTAAANDTGTGMEFSSTGGVRVPAILI